MENLFNQDNQSIDYNNLDFSKLKTYLDEGLEKAGYFKDKEIVLLIGCTGSGKSTLTAYLMGLKLIKNEFNKIEIDNT